MQQITLDRTGDSRHTFDVAKADELKAAEARFMELTGKGFLAATRPADGTPGRKLTAFDPAADVIVFMPQLVGG